jgi:hypothetical protein
MGGHLSVQQNRQFTPQDPPPDPPYMVHNQQVRQFTPHHRARAAQLAAAMLDYERSPDLITPPDPPMNIVPNEGGDNVPDDITL